MLDQQRQHAVDSAVSDVCDVFRGVADLGEGGDHALALLLLKYFSDIAQDPRDPGEGRCEGMRFIVPERAHFQVLYRARHQSGNGKRLDEALGALESANDCLKGVLQGISFNARLLGNSEQRDHLLCRLLEVFAAADVFDFQKDPEDAAQAVAHACDSLIRYVAANVGKRGGDFFTPPEISHLIARLLQPSSGEAIADPCCGSGSLLIACSQLARQKSGHDGCALFGQEKNGRTWALANMNMVLHGETSYQLEWGDTLRDPRLLASDGSLRKFEVVVSNLPFSIRDWGYEEAERDIHKRYRRGVPPRTAADYAFLSHMIETLDSKAGRIAVVVPLGVLFRGAVEGLIRRRLIEENLVDAVISLPPKMFPHTAIPVAILVLRKNKLDDDVLLIDASGSFERGKTQNVLLPADLDRIERAYRTRNNVDHYARRVTRAEIASNDYTLSVTRYVEAADRTEKVDLIALRNERDRLKAELAGLEARLVALLEEIGYA